MKAEWHLKKLLFFSLIKSAHMYDKKTLVELLSSPTIGCTLEKEAQAIISYNI
jgi:hypothetical protein